MKNENQQKVTIYTSSEFMGNFIRYEGKLIEHGTSKYAQYDNSPFVSFVPAGKRKGVQIRKSYQPMILILEGVGHPQPGKLFTKKIGESMEQSTYSSFDERWDSDFDNLIDKYIEEQGVKVIADYRYTKGFNSYNKPQPARQTHADYIAGLQAKGLSAEEIKKIDQLASI